MKIDNQLHKRLIKYLKEDYYKPTSIYPKSEKQMSNYRKKSELWIKEKIGAWEKSFYYGNKEALDARIQKELQLLKKFENEIDPQILKELAELNFRHFTEKYYIDMIVALREISIRWRSIRPGNDPPLGNYAKKILDKMLKVAIPRYTKGRPTAPDNDVIDAFWIYKRKLKLYRQIKKEITKSEYRNWQVFKSMLKRKYNVSKEELTNLRESKPSELAIEKTAQTMHYSIPWVKKQISKIRIMEYYLKTGQLIIGDPEIKKKLYEAFEIEQ